MDTQVLISLLKTRFENNMNRHAKMEWKEVEARILKDPKAISALTYMETTSGEPDVIGVDSKTQGFIYADCSIHSPKGRRSMCYDQAARIDRKKFPPLTSAMEQADQHGLEMMDEPMYRLLKTFGTVDITSSSWLKTPNAIRNQGGAIFGNQKYDVVFIYHNGADSYYEDRGFRAVFVLR